MRIKKFKNFKVNELKISKEIDTKLEKLVSELSYESMISSSPYPIIEDEKFKEIVSIGENAVPLLINMLGKDCGLVASLALSKITNVVPIPEKYFGNTDKVIEGWKNWKKAKLNNHEKL